jgi:hypothetical protein
MLAKALGTSEKARQHPRERFERNICKYLLNKPIAGAL